MKKILLGLVALFSLLCSSCMDEELIKRDVQTTRLSFTINTLDGKIIETRTSTKSGDVINNVTILFLDTNKHFLSCGEVTSSDGSIYSGDLIIPEGTSFFYVLANVSAQLQELSKGWVAGTTSIEDIKGTLKIEATLNSGSITEVTDFLPMVSVGADNSSTEIAYSGKKQYNVTLESAMAKVIVRNQSGNDNYRLSGVNMGNVSVSGYVFPGQSFNGIPKANYIGKDQNGKYSSDYMMKYINMEEQTAVQTMPLFVFETNQPASSETDGAFVIIKGEYDGITGYHRLNLWTSDGSGIKTNLPIQRNNQYIINITKIYTQGYATADEAIKHPASNRDITVDIEVRDPYSRDIISNGEYYLGVSNSKVVYFGDEALTGFTLTTVSHNATDLKGTYTCENIEGEGNVSVMENPFGSQSGSAVASSNLVVKVDQGVNKFDVLLRLGDLARRIRFERNTSDLVKGGVVYRGNFVYGKAQSDNGSHVSWVKMGEGVGTTDPDFVDLPVGNEFFSENVTTNNLLVALENYILLDNTKASPRQAEVILTEAGQEGHTCLKITQKPLNIFGGDGTQYEGSIDEPYAGAFWRSNQCGERIITMYIQGYGKLSWDAQVVIGQEWTRLELGKSKDTKVGYANPALNENIDYAEDFKLSDKAKTLIQGTEQELVFRIGLTGPLSNKEDHRYGLVLVNTYSGGTLQHTYRIFTRQGDAPDYLFRQNDGGYNGWNGGRPLTKKISAYNLTDPKLGKGAIGYDYVNNFFAHNVMPLDHTETGKSTSVQSKFTQYPTQAGYFFLWNIAPGRSVPTGSKFAEYFPSIVKAEDCMRAIHPVNNVGLNYVAYLEDLTLGEGFSWDTNVIPLRYDPKGDPCPEGYRTPSLGEVKEDGSRTDCSVDKSEFIQSFLFDPNAPDQGRDASAIMAKYTLWGYYADGFFDRQLSPYQMGFKSVRATSTDKEATGNDIAYVGMLIFNPFNFSSLFFPATGRVTPYGSIQGLGTNFYLWVSERDYINPVLSNNYPLDIEGNKSYFTIFRDQGAGSHPRAVRCVVE